MKQEHMKKAIIIIIGVISLAVVLVQATRPKKKKIAKVNGVSFVAPIREFAGNPIVPVKKVAANWVAVMPYAYCRAQQTEIFFDTPRQWWGERTVGAKTTIERAKELGLQVMLKPHLWVMGQGWTGDFELSTDDQWKVWEKEYEDYVIPLAKMADELDVEMFCIGLEYRKVVQQRPLFWKNLIPKIREVYSGPLTYAANWDNYEAVTFWEDLDYIGIDAYFPLSQADTPTKEELLEAWQEPFNKIKALHDKYDKPILFAEYGYRSINKAAGKQWELPSHRRATTEINHEVQQNAYEAIFEKFWGEEWFAGGFLWKWYEKHNQSGGLNNSDYTPQNKPVEDLIEQYYSNYGSAN